jgi:hypothetical protein
MRYGGDLSIRVATMSNEPQDYLAIMLLVGPLIACGIYLQVEHYKLGRLLAAEDNERLIAADRDKAGASRPTDPR